MTTATHAVRPKAAPPETRRVAAGDHVRAMGTPRYLRASLKLGGVHDPEEREAEHASGVIASGGCYKVHDPGGSAHLRAEADHKQVRPASAPRIVDPGAEGQVRRAIAAPVVDPGAAGRVRRAPAQQIHDPGGSAGLRAMHAKDEVRKAAAAMPPLKHEAADSAIASRIEQARAGAGRPLPRTVQARLEHGFGESMENVRVHTGPTARTAASAINARAYTEGERITLGHGESEHDMRLLAHEATHVVQNRRAAGVPRALPAAERSTRREMAPAPKREVRAEPAAAAAPATGPIRRLGLGTILNALADLANAIPGYRLFTIILGLNPINMEAVARSGANILRGAVEIIPGGNLIVRALDSYGIFDKAGTWVEQQFESLAMTGAAIRDALMQFLDDLGWRDILHPGDVWDRAKKIFTEPIDRMIAFFKALADGVIAIIKDAILRPLAALAAKTRAWDLVLAVLGKNPITGDPVPQTADTLIGGFMKLIGQEEIWENLKKANGVTRAFAWFKGAMAALLGFIGEIPTLFINALKSLVIEDLLDLPGAFMRIVGIFGDFAGRFFTWAGDAIWNMLEIIFDVVSPGAFGYVKKTGAALKAILKNPLPFVGNLVKAAKLGLNNFMGNFGEHLKAGLIDWLTGSLPGVYIPKALSLPELGKFALSVLGITWAQIRAKIVKALGPTGERIMVALETTFDIVVALVKGGPAAAWELIKEKLTNLKDMVVDGIVSFVTDTIIKKAIPKLISMFIPGAGFISAILSIYDTVMVFVQKLAKIVALVKSFVDSIVAIAAGQIAGAATRVEGALAGLLSLAISFLAGFLGLGNVAEKILGVIKKVQAFIDKALDTAINFIVGKAKALFAKLFGGKDAAPDDAKSGAIKKKAAAAVAGKSVNDASDEKSLLSSVYSRLAPEGLAGLKFVPNADHPGVLDVIASASIAEKVAQLDIGTKKGKQEFDAIVRSMTFYAGRTTMYVFYDLDHKQFGGAITSKRKDEGFGHAEHEFIDVFQYQLMPLIRLQRGQGVLKTPPGQKIPVHLDINRTPCDGCSESHLQQIVQVAQGAFSDVPIALSISSANLSTEKGAQRTTVDGLRKLLDAGVELSASTVWDEIEKQMKGHGITTVEYGTAVYSADIFVSQFKGSAKEVQELIDKVKAEQAKDKPVPVGAGNLQ